MWNSFCLLLFILSLFTSKVYVSWDQGSCSPHHFYIPTELSNKPGIEKIAILSCYLLDLKIIAFRNRERSKTICLNSHLNRKLRLRGITHLGSKAGLELDPLTPSFEWLSLSLHLSVCLPTNLEGLPWKFQFGRTNHSVGRFRSFFWRKCFSWQLFRNLVTVLSIGKMSRHLKKNDPPFNFLLWNS